MFYIAIFLRKNDRIKWAMDIEKIMRAGYFDNIRIDGVLTPVYNSYGTILRPNSTFKESLDKSDEAYKHGVAHLRINIIGESSTNINFGELVNMRQDRRRSRIPKLKGLPGIDRYIIGYSTIMILKGDYAIPYKINSTGKTEKDIEKLVKTNDLLELMLAALKLNKYVSDEYDCPGDWNNIAIVDKVYVYPVFRRCGISTWIHLNMADIINMYSLVFPNGILLSYGDFANERKRYGMSTREYNNMLIKHYKSLGYDKVGKLKLDAIPYNSNIMYKILI